MSQANRWAYYWPKDSGAVDRFLSAFVTRKPGKVLSKNILFRKFIKWAKSRGLELVPDCKGKAKFLRRVSKHFPATKNYTKNSFAGLTMAPDRYMTPTVRKSLKCFKYYHSPKGSACRASWRNRFREKLTANPEFQAFHRERCARSMREARARTREAAAGEAQENHNTKFAQE